MSKVNPLVWRVVGAAGALVAIIGALVAWATDPRFGASLEGTQLTEGKLLLAFAIVATLVIAWRHLIGDDDETAPWASKSASFLGVESVSRGSPHWAWVDRVVSLLGVAILIITITQWVDLERNLHSEANIGAGIYLALVGSLALIASGAPAIAELPKAIGNFNRKDNTSSTGSSNLPGSVADELDKLAGLLERGVITQEEFDAKKKEMLDL